MFHWVCGLYVFDIDGSVVGSEMSGRGEVVCKLFSDCRYICVGGGERDHTPTMDVSCQFISDLLIRTLEKNSLRSSCGFKCC